MAVALNIYDHTAKLFANGSNTAGDQYKLMLCSSATFNASNTTLAGIVKTELSAGNGYTTGGAVLSGVTVTQSGNDCAFDADDVAFTAAGGDLGPVSAGILYNSTDTGSPPLLYLDFGEAVSTVDGTSLIVQWHAAGIITFTVT